MRKSGEKNEKNCLKLIKRQTKPEEFEGTRKIKQNKTKKRSPSRGGDVTVATNSFSKSPLDDASDHKLALIRAAALKRDLHLGLHSPQKIHLIPIIELIASNE